MNLSELERETFRVLVDTFLPAIDGEGAAWTTPGGSLGLESRLQDVFSRLPSERDRKTLKLFLGQLRSPIGGLALFGKPKAFVAMSPQERATALKKLVDHRIGLISGGVRSLKTLVALLWVTTEDPDLRPAAWDGIGYPGPVGSAPDVPKPIELFEVRGDATLSCDVVVIGSGAGGGTAAAVLAQAGLDVIVLEAGQYLNESDFTHLEYDAYQRMYLDGALKTTADGGTTVLSGATLGGGTVINYTTSLATPAPIRAEWDRVARFTGVFGGQEYAESSAAVEQRLGVNLHNGRPSNRDRYLENGLNERGWHVGELPRNAMGCVSEACGYCTMGCRLGAKQSVLATFLQDAAESGARIITEARVDQLIVADDAVAGVVAKVRDDHLVVSSRAVVLAAGALNTPAILLRSGRGGPAVGRYLRLHPVTAVWARFEDRIDPWSGILQTRYSDEFSDLDGRGYGFKFETAPVHPLFPAAFIGWNDGETFKRDILGLGHLNVAGILLRDSGQGRVKIARDGSPIWQYRISRHDQGHIRLGVRRACELYASVGAKELITSNAQPIRWAPREESIHEFMSRVDGIGYASNRMSYFTFHQMGSARMGSNPETSVVGPDNQAHDTRGLYVMDGSCFPTSSGVNPMQSIATIAHRGAKILAPTLL